MMCEGLTTQDKKDKQTKQKWRQNEEVVIL